MLKEEPQGYVVAGSANIKNDFIENEILAPFIKKKILKVIDIAQGSE
jgi:peptide subunit release factor 1 (eRF1)